MLEPSVALDKVLKNIDKMGTEIVSTMDSLGRVLAERVVSQRDIPIFDSSAMDGYAVKASDVEKIPVTLKVLGTIAAGDDASNLSMNSGECWRIMTGAHLPKGSDTVIEYELTDDGRDEVVVNQSRKYKYNVRPAKDDIGIGDIIDKAGTIISPYLISRLISAGALHVKVYCKPRVAVISTGSEISPINEYSDQSKMLDANSPVMMNLVRQANADCSYLGVVEDDEDKLIEILDRAKNFDIIVVSGGISGGDFDYMAQLSKKVDLEWYFHKVNQKPGKPIAFGKYKGTPIFAMPGNPVSCMFCSFFYLIPALHKLMGIKNPKHNPVKVLLDEEVVKKKGRNQFDRARIEAVDGVLYARLFRSQNSNLINSMIDSNAFVELDADLESVLPAGTPVLAYIFNRDGLFIL